MTNMWRVPFVIGGLARLAGGVGMMLAPDWMGGRLAPRIQGHPGARMNSRGMGGTQTAVALYTLARAGSAQSARTVLSLNLLVDAFDLVGVSLLERRDRGEIDALIAGNLAVNGTALLIWTAAAASLRNR
jgi:hypothetical protein